MLKKKSPATLSGLSLLAGVFQVGFRRGLTFDGLFIWQVFKQAKTKSVTGESY